MFVFVVALAVGRVVEPLQRMTPAATPTCAEAWIAGHGKAPEPPAAPNHPTPAQQADYATVRAAWKATSNAYQHDAVVAGVSCIFGGAAKAPQPSTPAEAMSLLEAAIGAHTSFVTNPPADMATFCPRYPQASLEQKQQVWRNIFMAIIPNESGFKNASMMIDGEEYSIGLYQMSIHNGCAFASEADIADPAKNTACAVRKMEILATAGRLQDTLKVRYGLIGGDVEHLRDGAAHYWRTLRYKAQPNAKNDTTTRGQIIAAARSSPGCQ